MLSRVRKSVSRPYWWLRSKITRWSVRRLYYYFAGVAFDRRYSIDTNKIVAVADLGVRSTNLQYAVRYQPTVRRFIRYILHEIAIDPREYIFVDFGSGKGRVLLEAAAYDFKRIIGVEFSPVLHAIAEQTVMRYQAKTGIGRNIELVCANAEDFPFPNENIVLYLYNPFGAEIMAHVLDNLRNVHATSREIILVYMNPTCNRLIDKSQFLHLQSSGTFGLDRYDVYGNRDIVDAAA